jgi:hypothetical protein
MANSRAVIIGCLAALVAFGLMAACGVGACLYLAKDPDEIEVVLEKSGEAVVGGVSDLVVRVRNVSGRTVTIGDVDIDDTLLAGFTVESVEPPPKSSTQVSLLNARSHTFDLAIPPSETRALRFRLRGVREGIHRGDVTVYVGFRSRSLVGEIVVGPSGSEEPPGDEGDAS